MERVDIKSNRQQRNYTPVEMAARVLWAFGKLLFYFSPRPCFFWRRWLLKWFGATIGSQVQISNTADVFAPWLLTVGDYTSIGNHARIYNLDQMTIGNNVTISQGAHLCGGSHDYTDRSMRLLRCPITIGNDVWICADAFIGPNVVVGAGAIVAARAVVVKDVPEDHVVAGNPAAFVKQRNISASSKG